MQGIISDIRAVAETMFLSGDWIFLAMVVVALLIGVIAMRNIAQLFCASLLAMVVLAVIWMVYSGATGAAPSDPATYLDQLTAGWATLKDMAGTTLVGYLVTFAAAIIVLFIGKSLIFRD